MAPVEDNKNLDKTVNNCVHKNSDASFVASENDMAQPKTRGVSHIEVATASFDRSSMLSTLNTATIVISAVCQPFLAKLADISSRVSVYIVVLVVYIIGYIVCACSPTISAYVIGNVSSALGICSSPYLFTVWFSSYIAQDIVNSNWRWGYAMYAIIMPVILSPAIFIMYYYDRKAHKEHHYDDEGRYIENIKKDAWYIRFIAYLPTLKKILIEVDAFGLIVMGFGWSLLLLPFSLQVYAENGWRNKSMIAMMVVGGVLLIFYGVYEIFLCPFPSMPARVLNKTFVLCIVIDFIYQFAGYTGLNYLSSYVYITQDWTYINWSYYNNDLTISLCSFGIIAGFLFKVTHRYKFLQIFGFGVKLIGMGLMVQPQGQIPNASELIFYQILVGVGGSFSVVATHVAFQASVPHQDMCIAISLLSLWSSIAGSIGSAVAGAIWNARMPGYLSQFLPSTLSDAEVQQYFLDITAVRALPFNSKVRQGAIKVFSYRILPLYPIIMLMFYSFRLCSFSNKLLFR